MPVKFIRNFIKLEASGGIILFAAALIAIIIDNSPLSPYYEQLLEIPLSVHVGSYALSKHLLHWVNDGLMVLFFLLVGLEIKREIVEGELNSIPKVILPALAALGGMIVPAAVYSLINHGNAISMRGWAIPTATDIAFSLGIISLLGTRVPISLKIFLTALAIFDDLGAIIVIAIFYTEQLSTSALMLALFFLFILLLLNRASVRSLLPYILVGACMWLCLLQSGVHATLAGVALAFLIPLKSDENKYSPAKWLIAQLHPWIIYLVLPIFAFTNAGVSFHDVPPGLANIFSPVMLGILLGLLVGKMIGVFGTTFLAIKLRLVKMPHNANW
ncbi:MAG TPA: Na+/H+ antiporter NhaA, partial [Myxococcota bacterium]|nr:Na+/H+ antiporter NhaA [Myxococcota bacterium]